MELKKRKIDTFLSITPIFVKRRTRRSKFCSVYETNTVSNATAKR
uniref:Uncharacterized protein n=1 Tax=Lepeophtheirus salmonis TaxID=72036 RepID=A0A0K2U8W5_LEPSM